MAFSEMNSRERTIVIVLGIVILVALVGIGILAARLIAGDGNGGDEAIGVTTATASAPGTTGAATPGDQAGATITAVAPPPVEDASSDGGEDELPPAPSGGEPAVVVRAESPGPIAPAIIPEQTLAPGHSYRLEITAADGSEVAIQGSWSQAATSASGEVVAPQIEFFEGTTPHQIQVEAPVADPASWRISVSAGPTDLLGQPPALVITIWDVTGTP
jgi:hypothetical protein